MPDDSNINRRAAAGILLSAAVTSCHLHRNESKTAQVRLAVTRGSFLNLPANLAGPLGYFDAEGVPVRIEETASSPRSTQSLLGGSADIAVGGILRPLMLAIEGRRVKAFVVMLSQPGFVAAVSPRASRPIRRINDLKGANVGTSTPGSDYHLMFNHVLKAHALDPSAIQMIAIGTAASAAAALERGTVDVGLIAGTTIPLLEKRHPGLTYVMDTRTSEGTREQLGVSEFPMSLLYAKSDWLNENADTVFRVTRSIRRATEWIRTHSPAEIREKLPESYRTDREADLEALRFTIPMLPEDGTIHPETVKAAWGVLATTNGKTGPASLKLEDTYTNRFLH